MGLTATSFTLFPNLPPELRAQIWDHAFDELYLVTRPPGTRLYVTFEGHLDSIQDEYNPTRPAFDRIGYHFTIGGMTIPDYRTLDIGTVNSEARRQLEGYLDRLPNRWPNALTDGRGAVVLFDPDTDVIEMDTLSLVTMYHYMIPRRHRLVEPIAIGPRVLDRLIRGFESVQRLAVPYFDFWPDFEPDAEIFRRLRIYFLTGLQDDGGIIRSENDQAIRTPGWTGVHPAVAHQLEQFAQQQGYGSTDRSKPGY